MKDHMKPQTKNRAEILAEFAGVGEVPPQTAADWFNAVYVHGVRQEIEIPEKFKARVNELKEAAQKINCTEKNTK